MNDAGTWAAVIGALVAVGGFGDLIRRNLKRGHQDEIAKAVQAARDKMRAEQIARDQAHELADALGRIAELERDRPPRQPRDFDGSAG